MEFQDYYAILNVPRTATDAQIKSAYRRLARKHHPDVNKDAGAEDQFKRINEAYEVLGDAAKRAQYDKYGTAWQEAQRGGASADDLEEVLRRYMAGQKMDGFGNFRPEGADAGGDDGAGFSDFFESLFGRATGGARGFGDFARPRGATATESAPRIRRGRDVLAELEVSFADTYLGGERQITFDRDTSLDMKVAIPAGARNGEQLRFPGKGHAGANGGPAGDLVLELRVLPDLRFTPDEEQPANLRTAVDVPLYTALLGGEVPVPTPDGKRLFVKIPAETANGRVIRLANKGMPLTKGEVTRRGDLLVQVRVQLPTHLTDEEKRLFTELRGLRA